MGTPVFILAGQSNAFELSDEIEFALDDRYGVGNYEFLSVYAAGAPLTRERDDRPDWNDPSDLRGELTARMIDVLDEDPDHVIGGMIWVQGEADTYFSDGAVEYAESLEGLIDDLRDDVTEAMGARETGLDVAPVTILELSENAPAAQEREAWDRVISEQREVADDNALIATLDPDRVAEDADIATAAMFKDGLHFDDDFQYLLAEELVETMEPPSSFGIGDESAPPEEPIDDPETPPVVPVEPVEEPIIPVVDPVEPSLGEEVEVEDDFDDGSSIGDFAWLFAFLPFLGLLG